MSENRTPVIALGGEPRANLLPPEVLQRAKARSTRRILLYLVVLAVILVGGGVGFATLNAATAQARLAEAQAQSQALLDEQLSYAEAVSVVGLLAATTEVRGYGTATEVIWAGVFAQISALLPAGSVIDSTVVAGSTPWDAALTPTGPLRSDRVATVQFVIRSTTVPEGTALVRSLKDIPGFADASLDSVTLDGESYLTAVTLNLNDKALSGRYLPDGTEKVE